MRKNGTRSFWSKKKKDELHSASYLWDFAILISLSIILMYRYTKKDKNPRWFELISRFLSWFSFINWGIILSATKNNSQSNFEYKLRITSRSDILLRLSLFFKACLSKIKWIFYDSRKLQNISSNYYYMKAKHMQKHYESLFWKSLLSGSFE